MPHRLVVILALCGLGLPATAQDPSVDEVTSMTEQVSQIEAPDDAMRAALRGLLSAVAEISATPTDDVVTITEAERIIRLLEEPGTSDAAIDSLGTTIARYQQEVLTARLIQQAMALTEALNNAGPAGQNAALMEPLSALVLAIQTIEGGDRMTAITQEATRLNGLLAANSPVRHADEFPESLERLRDTLLGLEQSYFLEALELRVEHLTEMLGSIPSNVELQTAHVDDLVNLQSRIDSTLQNRLLDGIHIVSAQFGHVAGTGSGVRCNVTNALRQVCQFHDSCALTAEEFEGLCGGVDPAPLATGLERGVLVNYQCLNTDRTSWSEVLATSSNQLAGTILQTIIRSPADGIYCAWVPQPD